jgi:mannosyltransferase OCH1-like enzyme
VYLDLDVGCKKDLTPLLRFEITLPKTSPTGVSNDVLITAPNHPFFRKVIDNLPASNHYWGPKYFTVFFSTGPMFLTNQLFLYLKENPSTEVRILPPDMYASTMNSFFDHYPGSSWHGNDVKVLRFLLNGYHWLLALLALVGLVLYLGRPRFQRIWPVSC